MSQPPVIRSAQVARSIEDTFEIFTREIGAWWPLPNHGIFGERAGGVQFIDDQLVELATDGSRIVWAEVLEWDAPTKLRLAWHPGQPADGASEVEVNFEVVEAGTRVEIRHSGWEKFGAEGVDRRRSYVGPSAWGYVLDHLADGAETRSDVADLVALEAAYVAFFAEAESGVDAGDFGPPESGHWNAAQVLAHVALNDLAMVGVAQALVHGGELAFENHTCQVPENLAKVIEEASDMQGLIAFGRACARSAVGAARRLNAAQRETLVQCTMEHEGTQVMDDVRPWGAIAITVQAEMHLPAHIAQLQNLRS